MTTHSLASLSASNRNMPGGATWKWCAIYSFLKYKQWQIPAQVWAEIPQQILSTSFYGFLCGTVFFSRVFFLYIYKCDADLKSTEMGVEPRLTDWPLFGPWCWWHTRHREQKAISAACVVLCRTFHSPVLLLSTHTQAHTVVIDSCCRWSVDEHFLLAESWYYLSTREERKNIGPEPPPFIYLFLEMSFKWNTHTVIAFTWCEKFLS